MSVSREQVQAAIRKSPVAKPMSTHVVQAFCAGCQAKGDHEAYGDHNQEVVFVCKTCGRHFKVALSVFGTPDELAALLARHEESSSGQVTVEMAQAEQQAFDEEFRRRMGIA